MKQFRKVALAAIVFGVLSFSSCQVPCGDGQLWFSNNTSHTIYLHVEGYYTDYLSSGELLKLTVIPDVPIYYESSYGTATSNYYLDGEVTVEDCETAAVDLD